MNMCTYEAIILCLMKIRFLIKRGPINYEGRLLKFKLRLTNTHFLSEALPLRPKVTTPPSRPPPYTVILPVTDWL